MRLFADRAQTALPGFTVDAFNQDAIVRLCQRLGGIPLAIELAAVQVRAMAPERILARLEDHYLQAMSAGAQASQPRLQTLQASIDSLAGVQAWLYGEMRRGMQMLEDALGRWHELDDRTAVWTTLKHLAVTAACLGNRDLASSYGEQCVDFADAYGGTLTKPWSLGVHGLAEWLAGDRQRAARLVRESLVTLPSPVALSWGVTHFLEVLAWDAAARGDAERAARLLGNTNTSWRFMATPVSRLRTVATEHPHCEQHLRAALGELKFHTLFDEGAGLTTDRAIAYALSGGKS